jgi:hypothetical protein
MAIALQNPINERNSHLMRPTFIDFDFDLKGATSESGTHPAMHRGMVTVVAGNQSVEDLVMRRASARFTNFPPCFL